VKRLLCAWLSLPIAVRAAAPFGLMAALWWSSSRPHTGAAPSVLRSLLHNGAHVVAYGALAASVLLWLGAALRQGQLPRRAAIAAIVVAIGYGVVDEWHQSTVPGRVCSVVDIVSDALGAALATALVGHSLGRHRGCARAVPFLVVGSLCSVVVATFGPW